MRSRTTVLIAVPAFVAALALSPTSMPDGGPGLGVPGASAQGASGGPGGPGGAGGGRGGPGGGQGGPGASAGASAAGGLGGGFGGGQGVSAQGFGPGGNPEPGLQGENASALGGYNAARAADPALENAAPGSMVGLMAAYRDDLDDTRATIDAELADEDTIQALRDLLGVEEPASP